MVCLESLKRISRQKGKNVGCVVNLKFSHPRITDLFDATRRKLTTRGALVRNEDVRRSSAGRSVVLSVLNKRERKRVQRNTDKTARRRKEIYVAC